MQIKNLTFLELFIETMCNAADSPSQCELECPLSSDTVRQGARETTLTKQLNGSDSFMLSLADSYEANGEHKLAGSTRKLAKFVSTNDSFTTPDKESHQRLLDYVYPIV